MGTPTRRSCRRTSCAPSRQPCALSAGSRAAAARAFSAVLLNLAAAAQDGFAAKRDSKSGSGLGLMLAATTYMYDVEADGGSLCLWPRTHLPAFRYFAAHPDEIESGFGASRFSNIFGEDAAQDPALQPLEFTARAGDAVFWHNLLFRECSNGRLGLWLP